MLKGVIKKILSSFIGFILGQIKTHNNLLYQKYVNDQIEECYLFFKVYLPHSVNFGTSLAIQKYSLLRSMGLNKKMLFF